MTTGNCKHGQFDLRDGCAQCTADRRGQEALLDKIANLPLVTEVNLAETAVALRPGEDIEAQIKVVIEARQKTTELKSQRDTLLEDWNKANQVLFDALTQAGAEAAEAETKLKELTLQAYEQTGNKAPALGVSIKIFQTLDYDPKEALKWAMSHQLALNLDKKSFENLAKTTPLEFVTTGEEPRAQIAQNLK